MFENSCAQHDPPGSCSDVMHFKSGKSCIDGSARRIGAVLSTTTSALSFAISFSFFLSLSLSPPPPSRPHSSLSLPFTFLSSFLAFIFFFLFVVRTQRDESLSRMRFNERESVALARGLHDCRNCRYAAKVEGV